MLKDTEGHVLKVNSNIKHHEYYIQIWESFQKQYEVCMEFMEVQHHEMDLFESYHNLKFSRDGRIDYTYLNEKSLSILGSSVLNSKINIWEVTSIQRTDNIMDKLKVLSGVYRNITSTWVETSIVYIILVCIREYINKMDTYQPLCLKSLKINNKEILKADVRTKFQGYWKEWLTQFSKTGSSCGCDIKY